MCKQFQRERIMQAIEDQYGCEPEYLWADTPDSAIFRHPGSGKWYAAFLSAPSHRLGLGGKEPLNVLNLKCSPMMIGSLLSAKGFLPAYHMNKSHWISILLNDSVPDDQIFPLLEWSYNSVGFKRNKRPVPDK